MKKLAIILLLSIPLIGCNGADSDSEIAKKLANASAKSVLDLYQEIAKLQETDKKILDNLKATKERIDILSESNTELSVKINELQKLVPIPTPKKK